MSVGSELDVDVQDLVANVLTSAVDLVNAGTVDEGAQLDMRDELLGQLRRRGWLPPTHTAHVKAKVQEAYAASENDDAFRALRSAADVLGVVLVDPDAAVLESLTPDLLNSLTLGKVA